MHQSFVITTKSRAVLELFSGINEFKNCLQDPASKVQWKWRRTSKRDKSGCVVGPLRAIAAVYLLKADIHQWFVGSFMVEREGKGKWKR